MFGRDMTMKEIEELEAKGMKLYGDTKPSYVNKEGEEVFNVSRIVHDDGGIAMY